MSPAEMRARMAERAEARARETEARTGRFMCRLCGGLFHSEVGRMVHGHLSHETSIERVNPRREA